MLTLMVCLSRRADLSEEAFARHLRDTHAPLVAQLPGLRRLLMRQAFAGQLVTGTQNVSGAQGEYHG